MKWIFCLLMAGLAAQAEVKTVDYVDPSRYVGTWYQIARNPVFFENGCVCSRQVLTPTDVGVSVYNTCNRQTVTGPLLEIRGTATIDDPTSNSRLTVDFGLPKKGQYWIIGLDHDYRFAVVSDSTGDVLYVLSKTPTLSDELYNQAVALAAAQVRVDRLTKTLQEGCSYPQSLKVMAAPAAPTDQSHPGSKIYDYTFQKETIRCSGREVTMYTPNGKSPGETFPAVVFGHGQALNVEHYAGTFEHLAKKGVAAIHPMYDNGFFDQDWTRMGRDFVTQADCALNHAGSKIARDQIVFSGHSKGSYVASIAAGLAEIEGLKVKPGAVVLLETAGFDSASASRIAPSTALTVVFSDQDTVVERNLSEQVFAAAPSLRKQFILMKSYPDLKADHYWPQTKGTFFGGGPESALHYYGSWKWLTAAAMDLKAGNKGTNPYLYGDQAGDKGTGTRDDIRRNW